MNMTRLNTFILSLLFVLLAKTALASPAVENVNDLRKLKQQMKQEGVPTLLLFSTEGCRYCEAIRENYLVPMMKAGTYNGQILFRQLEMNEYSLLRNEQGKLIGGDEVALRYLVDVAPTILFVDAEGKEVAKRIVGLSGADYFDKTLQLHIDQARKNMSVN